MSISPINFNGMIQNTPEVSNQKVNEDVRPEIIQHNLELEKEKKDEQTARQVNATDEKDEEYRLGDGKGKGGEERKQQKQKKKKEVSSDPDGVVIKKDSHQSFNITI